MIKRNIDKEFQINKEFLDTIDFIPFLKEFGLLSDMMTAVEKKYQNVDGLLPPELEGLIFNYFSEEGFKDYLSNRYSNLYLYPVEDYLIDFRG
jgi:hypothetical protein